MRPGCRTRRATGRIAIEADGAWTIIVRDESLADVWDGQATLTATADSVIRVEPPISGLTVVTVAHEGEGNFAVTAEGGLIPDLIVNEIGAVSEETTLPVGTNLLEITADGAWSITLSKCCLARPTNQPGGVAASEPSRPETIPVHLRSQWRTCQGCRSH